MRIHYNLLLLPTPALAIFTHLRHDMIRYTAELQALQRSYKRIELFLDYASCPDRWEEVASILAQYPENHDHEWNVPRKFILDDGFTYEQRIHTFLNGNPLQENGAQAQSPNNYNHSEHEYDTSEDVVIPQFPHPKGGHVIYHPETEPPEPSLQRHTLPSENSYRKNYRSSSNMDTIFEDAETQAHNVYESEDVYRSQSNIPKNAPSTPTTNSRGDSPTPPQSILATNRNVAKASAISPQDYDDRSSLRLDRYSSSSDTTIQSIGLTSDTGTASTDGTEYSAFLYDVRIFISYDGHGMEAHRS